MSSVEYNNKNIIETNDYISDNSARHAGTYGLFSILDALSKKLAKCIKL
jgi:hypothetical protein